MSQTGGSLFKEFRQSLKRLFAVSYVLSPPPPVEKSSLPTDSPRRRHPCEEEEEETSLHITHANSANVQMQTIFAIPPKCSYVSLVVLYPNVCALKPLFVFLLIIEMVKMGDIINKRKERY